jgi:hypothetical protein
MNTQSAIVERGQLNNLDGDRRIAHAFVVTNLLKLDNKKHEIVLDIGCVTSPLTTIMKELSLILTG